MRVENIMSIAKQRMMTTQTEASLADAASGLSATHTALLVVCNSEGVMAGVITKTDVVRQVVRRRGVVNDVIVSDVMSQPVISCRQEDALYDVLNLMKRRGFVHIPIIDPDGRPCGVVNARDALQALLGEVKDEELLLREYVMGIGYR